MHQTRPRYRQMQVRLGAHMGEGLKKEPHGKRKTKYRQQIAVGEFDYSFSRIYIFNYYVSKKTQSQAVEH